MSKGPNSSWRPWHCSVFRESFHVGLVQCLELSRPSDGFTWTLTLGPGTTRVGLPVLGLLGQGSYEWQVTVIGSPSVSFETLSASPSDPSNGLAALDLLVTSESRAVAVP